MTHKNPLLSIIITSYTMERFKDICDLFDSIKSQTLISQKVNSQQSAAKPPNSKQKSSDYGLSTLDYQTIGSRLTTNDYRLPTIEVIFVAERSRELYERVKEKGKEILGDLMETRGDLMETESPNLYKPQHISTNHKKSQQVTINYKVLFNEGEPGLSAARNLGIANAKGEIIGFVDDDVLLSPDWAEEVIKSFDDESIIGITGPAYPLWEDESMSWFPEEFYWIISCTAWFACNEKKEVRNAWGMNMAFRKEAFDLCGLFLNEFGFHKGLFAEDNEFSLRVKTKTGKHIVYCPNIKLWHRVHKYRINRKFIKERAYWIGRSRRNLKRLHGKDNKDLLSTEHRLLRRIFTRLFPKILKDLFKNPAIAWRKLSIAFIALLFLTLGYYHFHT